MYKVYIFSEANNIQQGGGLAENLESRFRNPVYTLPAGTDIVRSSVDVPNLPMVMRQPYANRGSLKEPRVRKTKRSRKSRGKTGKRKSGTHRRRR